MSPVSDEFLKRPFSCCLCPAHPSTGQDVFRVNPTGEDGIWACRDCYGEASRLWAQGKIVSLGPGQGLCIKQP